MNIEKHPVMELARQTPTFLMNGRVYVATEGKVNGNFFETKRLFFSSTKPIPILDLSDFDSLDNLFLERSHADIERFEKEYVDEVKNNSDIFRRIRGEFNEPQLIYKYVFPHLRRNNDKIAKAIGIEVEPQVDPGKIDKSYNVKRLAKESMQKINEMIRDISHINSEKLESLLSDCVPQISSEPSFLSKAFGDRNIALLNGRVYDTENHIPYKFNINSELSWDMFIPKLRTDLIFERNKFSFVFTKENYSDWIIKYSVPLSHALKLNTLRKCFSEEVFEEALNDERINLFDFVHKDSHNEEDFGFFNTNKGYYVYLDVPSFAIKSQFDRNYYLFDKSRVGFMVSSNNGRLTQRTSLCMIQNVRHPLTSRDRNYADICIGKNNLPSGKNDGETIAKILKKGKEIVIYGYSEGLRHHGCRVLGKCNNCRINHYADNIRTEKQIEELGVCVADARRKI